MKVAVCSETNEITLRHRRAVVSQKNVLSNSCLTDEKLRMFTKTSCY
jgi:hypothetical protein